MTGQTLKKIIDFLEHLEKKLLNIIQKFGQKFKNIPNERLAEGESLITRQDIGVDGQSIDLHGPDESEELKSTQGDVDSLLADLGF